MKRYIRSDSQVDDKALAKNSKDPQELSQLYEVYYDPDVKFMSHDFAVLSEIAKNRYTPQDILESLYFDTGRASFKNLIAANPNVPQSVIYDILSKSGDTILTGNLCKNKGCPTPILQDLLDTALSTEDHFLLAGLANNSKLTSEMFDELEAFIMMPEHYNKPYSYDVIRGLNKNSGFRRNHDLLPLK